MRVRVEDSRREAGSIVIANPNVPTGVALPRAEIARLLEDHPDIAVVIDEAYVDTVARARFHSSPIIRTCWSCRRCRSRALWPARGLPARRHGADRGAPPREKQLQFLPARPPRPGGRDGFGSRRRLLPRELREGRRRTRSDDAGADPAWLCRSAFEREFRLRQASGAGRAGIRRRRCANMRCWCGTSTSHARRPICVSPSGRRTTCDG